MALKNSRMKGSSSTATQSGCLDLGTPPWNRPLPATLSSTVVRRRAFGDVDGEPAASSSSASDLLMKLSD